MVSKSFPIFDCDSHLVEPPAIWDEYVPKKQRAWVKTQFCFHTDSDVLFINGRVVPAARERSNAAEVGWARWNKKEVGALTPGTKEWQAKFGRLAGCRDPHARLKDMDALGTDQVMLFPTWFVRLALLRDPAAARILAAAYNDWAHDYCAPNRKRLFPCAVLPIQSVEHSIAELRRVAKLGFKAAAVRPCFWNGRYPTLPEFDPLWREFEALGMVLAMHTFPSREALTPEWGERMAKASGSGQGLLFTNESIVYSPGQFVSNIAFAMDPGIDASEALGFIFEAMTWLTTVLMTGWFEKFPKLRAAVLESNASWLPLVLGRSRNFLDLFAFQRTSKIKDPFEIFYDRCFIGFESDEEPVYRMWDYFENVAIWSSDYPHHDAEDAWEALELMAKHKVPPAVQKKLLGENARRLYGIEPIVAVSERIKDHAPAILAW
ncbi:MAG: amidohydrolase family protein [Proteobacteria bacterium]|nr:amidohydrolase family protein [Pseudomonadota bacterium]